jgi:hypothetical protein
MEAQEIVNRVWERLNDGKGRAGRMRSLYEFAEDSKKYFQCEYCDATGNKCAVGIFIPDDHPAQKVIADVSELLMDYGDDEAIAWMIDHEDLLDELQKIHDTEGYWNDKVFNGTGQAQFQYLCKTKDLKFPG